MLRAVILTQFQRVTDGQTDGRTDGIAIASTALAMRALQRECCKNKVNNVLQLSGKHSKLWEI